MPDVTAQILVDLDGSGAYATDITAYCWRSSNDPSASTGDMSFNVTGRGRTAELDAAGPATLDLALDNGTGRFSPLNGSSPYASGGVNLFRPYILIKATMTFNAVTYDLFKGVITGLSVHPANNEATVYVTAQDAMFVLSRTEIRRPLMLNQYTGVIIHRLLDDVEGAEGREACTNPAFALNDTGWTPRPSATITRMTGDDKILEGAGALRVVTSAANSGARHTMTGIDGDKYRLTAYVKPERDADIGLTVQVRLNDGLGIVALGSTVTLERDHWQRCEVEGTYNAGSTEQYIDILAPTSGTQFRVGAAHAVPFVNAINRDVDDGKARLHKFSWPRRPALEAVQKVREDELGALFLFDGAGTAVFQDKHHRFGLLSSSATFDERFVMDFQESGDDLYKAMILDYPHWVDGVPGTPEFELDRVISIAVGKTERVEADYQGGLLRDTITPVVNIDYTITFAGDGTGGDATGSVAFTFEDYGGASVGTFTNNHASKMVYLRTYKVRGTPVRLASDRTPARYTPATGPALAAPYSHSFELNGSEPDIQAMAEYWGDRFSEQRQRLVLNLSASFPEAELESHPTKPSHMTQILARRVSERITVINDNLPFSTKVNGDYHIDSIDLRCTGKSIDATWRLSPVDLPYYVIGDTIAGQLVAP